MDVEGKLLKDVSRSFYLTLRLLPRSVRPLISLAYLLARASDTIADTASVAHQQRLETLELFRSDLLGGQGSSAALSAQLQQEFSQQSHEGERVLMGEVAALFSALATYSAAEQAVVRAVMQTIIEGQLWDLAFFDSSAVVQVPDNERLLRYTYEVAGCVGEFWTSALALKGLIPAEQEAPLRDLGRKYGQGLQLVNIIRDIPEDYQNGRVYIPHCPTEPEAIVRASEHWLAQAETFLHDGITYSHRLPLGRLRTATILPARLGLDTLTLLRQTPIPQRAQTKVKITRSKVFSTLARSILAY